MQEGKECSILLTILLLSQVFPAEQNADVAIKHLLEMNSTPLTKLLEQEKQEEESLLKTATNKYNETLSRLNVLENMQKLLEQETRQLKQFHESRAQTTRSILEQ